MAAKGSSHLAFRFVHALLVSARRSKNLSHNEPGQFELNTGLRKQTPRLLPHRWKPTISRIGLNLVLAHSLVALNSRVKDLS